ncbi:5-(carboxyamino)imidazole ribonucleotide synthase [Microbacterium terrae]|uniref:N5-carboxyaminoimidazole ribonucleotide synthase n=1 Tax=Microbacterium terrae TaxID=69369 RepID=A0A0M2H5F3_9MICO|nr:5-(carboxyamino)imidazole ribonucleotide synthase [Microbacterium terrae]KJL41720.1 N5-carboxyaminoimidazole ribonucleotide synthase [Microbacterium terrae]MBP1077989.1 5-(carboxyamino)imidazole ribonucleotide synthase [Microbacterium terrae]GLK00158.1 N5-carboxyaminoimidazole ribonucleotide synthase [Microbacterium terrae]
MALRVGVVGGGQLARMMIAPAVELGIELSVLAEDEGMSAALAATAVGDYRDADTVLAFAQSVDVITFDHEHVPQTVLGALVDAGVAVHPGPHALRIAQDKLVMRARLQELGMPQPDWAAVEDTAALQEFLDAHGGRAVVKTPRGGYDGKGVRVVADATEADDWFAALAEDANGGALLVEELVDFTRELAQQVARRPSGEVRAYPVVETVQRDGVCAEVIAPAPHAADRLQQVTAQIGVSIAEGLDVTGMLAVELFETTDERVLVNELAMRPHNSGHWSQDGATTGQFEQHLRAVLDLPLGDPQPVAPWAVMVNILGGPAEGGLTERFATALAEHPSAKVHTYGKAPRPGRKVGHVTVSGDDLDDVAYQARAAAAHFLD